MELDPRIAERAAATRLNLEWAQARYAEAIDRVATLRRHIAENEESRQRITDKRLAGAATREDTAEFAALAGDITQLEALLQQALADVAEREPLREQRALVEAEDLWERHRSAVYCAALRTRATELEATLLDCVIALSEEARRFGPGLYPVSWHPSDRLRKAVLHGWLR